MDRYPVNLDVEAKRCLVVGGGQVAERKVEGLLACRARVTVVAPKFVSGLRERAAGGSVRLVERIYRPADLDDVWLVITATDDADVNAQVFREGSARRIWVNSADDPANCAFTLPSVARRGDLMLTASTDGRSPALASWFRRRWNDELDDRWDRVVEMLSDVRQALRRERGTSEVPGWSGALDDGVVELILEGRDDEARRLLHEALGLGVAA